MKEKIIKKRNIVLISSLFLAYSLYFLVISYTTKNYEYIYYNFCMILGFFVLLLFYDKIHLTLSIFIGLLLLGFLHLAGGTFMINGLRLYETSLIVVPYDKIVHVFGAFVITLLAYNFIHDVIRKKDGRRRMFLIAFIIFMMGIGVGSIVENIEFFATLIFKNTIVGDYANNAGDLVANSIGALIAAIFSLVNFERNRKR